MTATLTVPAPTGPVAPAAPAVPTADRGATATVEKGTRLRRRAAGASMLGAAAISLAGYLATPWEGASDTPAYLRSLAEHPRQAMVAAVLLHFGYLLFVPTAFALARLARRGAAKLSAVGIALSVLGAGLSGLLVTDLYDLSIARHVGTTAGAAVSDMTGVPFAGLGFVSMALTSSVGAITGLAVLAIAMRRARLAPLWPAVAIVAGFLGAFGAHGVLRSCLSFGVLAVGVAFLGVRVLRMSDERFAYGADPR